MAVEKDAEVGVAVERAAFDGGVMYRPRKEASASLTVKALLADEKAPAVTSEGQQEEEWAVAPQSTTESPQADDEHRKHSAVRAPRRSRSASRRSKPRKVAKSSSKHGNVADNEAI